MSEHKHTPAPWKISTESGGRHGIKDGMGNYVGFTSLPYKIDMSQNDGESWLEMMTRMEPEICWRDEVQEANTRLIAAAPDMLEALEEVMRPYGIYDSAVSKSHKLLADELMATGDKIKAAIAKATGKEVQP